jgi:hypothetical protein
MLIVEEPTLALGVRFNLGELNLKAKNGRSSQGGLRDVNGDAINNQYKLVSSGGIGTWHLKTAPMGLL